MKVFILDEIVVKPGEAAAYRQTYTHVWEQEFDNLDGLTGEYMNHPVHWGLADAFFDAECPEYIVDPHLVQVVGAIDQTIMA